MLKNYIKIAWRNLVKGKLYSIINVVGLTVGITCCLLILLYIQKELSYDTFHKNSDRIYRISRGDASSPAAWVTNPVGPDLEQSYPSVQEMVQISAGRSENIIEYGNKQFYESGFVYATPSLFGIFDFPVVTGNAQSLREPYNLFLSESMAEKYFSDESPVGKVIKVNNEQSYTVTGIFKDIPDNSHIKFDFVGSRASQYASGLEQNDWAKGGAYTYVLLNKNADPKTFQSKIENFRSSLLKGSIDVEKEEYIPESLIAAPLTDIHLYSDFELEMIPQGDIVYVYLFGIIALLILVIACINYMNLATSRAVQRAREVGIRKTSGAHRVQLIKQYLSESYLLVLIALALSIVLVELFLPAINNLMQRSMSISWSDPYLLLFLVGLWVITGLGAGGYPALYLSGFRPVRVLQGTKGGQSKGWLRKALVTFQLAISIILIISTIVVQKQMKLARTSQPGFDNEQVVMIPTRKKVGARYNELKVNLQQNSAIKSVTTTSFEPGEPGSIVFFTDEMVEGYNQPEAQIIMDGIYVGFGFTEAFGLDVVNGRPFSKEYKTDVDQALMINEQAVEYFGWEKPIGKSINYGGKRKVVGVVENFHYKSLKEELRPALFLPTEEASRFILVKLAGGSIPAAVEAIQENWSKVIPEMPLNYSFLDDSFDDLFG